MPSSQATIFTGLVTAETMDNERFKVIIVGGGPVGLYMAHALQRANIEFVLLEKRKTINSPSGQLLFLWPQTVRLFDQIGLLGPLQDAALTLHQKKRTDGLSGKVLTTSDFWKWMHDNHGYQFLPLLREEVIRILAASLENADTVIKTCAHVQDITAHANGVQVTLEDGTCVTGSVVIGADGVHSKTRDRMHRLMKQQSKATGMLPDPNNPIVTSFHGIFGRASNTQLKLDPHVLFESRGSGTAIQCTGDENYLYFVTLTPRIHGEILKARYTNEDMEGYAASIANVRIYDGITFGDIWRETHKEKAVMVNQEEGFLNTWHFDRIALVGDAVHKSTSINGLGANCGLHSAAGLANQLVESLSGGMPTTAQLRNAFERYQGIRENECKEVWSQGYTMARQVTSKSWINWVWSTCILPWLDIEAFLKGYFVSLLLIRHGQILTYVPFHEKPSKVPWLQSAQHSTT